jgi:hypothetical protein
MNALEAGQIRLQQRRRSGNLGHRVLEQLMWEVSRFGAVAAATIAQAAIVAAASVSFKADGMGGD